MSAANGAMARATEEEEEMRGSGADQHEGWEFKILRCTGSHFKNRSVFRAALDEEAKAGWELLEKIDDHRVRLKRRIDCRDQDHRIVGDPYRTWIGMTPNTMALIMLGVLFGVAALGIIGASIQALG